MASSTPDPDRFLKERDGRWSYLRRVPNAVSHIDRRTRVQVALKTTSLEIARKRRDSMEAADDALWAAMQATGRPPDGQAREAYDRARSAAQALGFSYKTLDELAAGPTADLVTRIEALEGRVQISEPGARPVVQAILGGVPEPQTTINKALDEYFEIQGPVEMKGKSPAQIESWKKVKRRAVRNFVSRRGNKAMVDIDRDDALDIFDWWKDRVTGAAGGKKLSGNSANRDLGNLRVLYDWFFNRRAEQRPNPFAGLSFPNPKSEQQDVPPFPAQWIQTRLLVRDAWLGLNRDAALIFLSLVETGCRPSEVCNLLPQQIVLDHDVPHLDVRPRDGRGLKTDGSARRIPLVGVSLAAMRAAPNGFPRYLDRENSLSAVLMKHFRSRGLLPTPDHIIYSIRHAFEDRTLEKKVDRDLRARLMGHKVNRPDYGEGGSLAFRRDELLKIALPFPDDLIPSITGN
ncbi:MAG: DUF6538 domain-containing protein [Pseudomonadota bacterium]